MANPITAFSSGKQVVVTDDVGQGHNGASCQGEDKYTLDTE